MKFLPDRSFQRSQAPKGAWLLFFLFLFFLFELGTALPSEPEEYDVDKEYEKRRKTMAKQLSKEIQDEQVFKAMKNTPREPFVRSGLRFRAYMDEELPVEKHQFLSRPIEWARALELLQIPDKGRVLVLDPGVGYAGGLVSQIAEASVIITVPELFYFVQQRYEKMRFSNLVVKSGSPHEGWPERAPFDRIFVAGNIPKEVPQALFRQLAPGGFLLAPVGGVYQRWVRYRKGENGDEDSSKITREELSTCHFPPLTL